MSEGMTRRAFLRTGAEAGAVLLVAAHFPYDELLAQQPGILQPTAFVRVDAQGIISVVIDEAELGQGPQTALPMIVAEELDADWSQLRPLPPPEDPSTWLRAMQTGGSTSIRQGWDPFRQAAAKAREMLKSAAAEKWGVPVAECRTEKGEVVHASSNRRLKYGVLVERASQLPVPENPPMKPASEYRIVGHAQPRFDSPAKVRGEPVFCSDLSLPGMVVASVERPPAFGATLQSVDDVAARAVPGVLDVFRVPQGVAVVAKNTWAALQGRAALRLAWDLAPAQGRSSAALHANFEQLAKTAGQPMRAAGDAEAAFAAAAKKVEATYYLPYIDHVPMEPMIAVAHVQAGEVEVWAPTQAATAAQAAAARVAGVERSKVKFHLMMAGGGFGRRLASDDTELAVEVAKHVNGPVQVFWTREDSIRNGTYRPLSQHFLRGAVDAEGKPIAWLHRAMGPADRGLVAAGAESPPYALPNFLADTHLQLPPVAPVGPWRSVSYTHMGFVVETFVDELAALAGQDPYEFRKAHMTNPKLRAAMDLAVEKAGWGSALPAGRFRGLAAVSSFGSHCAQVVEISLAADGKVKVHRVVCGVHCGRVVNPDGLLAQVEGAIALALSYTLDHQITLVNGAVQESNFHDYPILRIDEMPVVELHTVATEEAPTGIGEPPVPPVAPAVANAIYAATGKRIRRLPIDPALLRR